MASPTSFALRVKVDERAIGEMYDAYAADCADCGDVPQAFDDFREECIASIVKDFRAVDVEVERVALPLEMVREFHELLGVPVRAAPAVPPADEKVLRRTLLEEEYEEYLKAHEADDVVGVADALADMAFVIFGTALAYGIPLDKVFEEVHRSNMTKGGDAPRADGKIVKGPGYEPPRIAELLGAA